MMIKILHVDDNPDHLELIKKRLQSLSDDLQIEWAESADQAIESLGRGEFDCILCDYQMPQKDGLQLLQSLRKSGNRDPVIFLTGQGNEEIAAKALRSGADDYYTKDLSFAHYERLVNRIHKVVEASKERLKKEQAEIALRESEERYRNLVERANDGITLLQDGIIKYINPRAAEMLGRPVSEVVGTPITQYIHSSERKKVVGLYKARMEGRGAPAIYETVLLRHDGGHFDAEVNAGVISHRGAPADLVIFRDVTERKRADLVQKSIYKISDAVITTGNLEELFGRIHAIVGELMPAENIYIALHDPVTDMVSYPYWVDRFDEKPEPEQLGKGLTAYVIRSGRPLLAIPEVFESLVAEGEVESIGAESIDWLGVPLRTEKKTIGVLTVQSYSEGVRYGEEEKDILVFVSNQIAMAIERKRAEEAIRKREEEYKNLLNNAQVGIYRSRIGNGKLVMANRRLADIFGYDSFDVFREQFITTESYVNPRDRERMLSLLKRDGKVKNFEARVRKLDGEVIWVMISARANYAEDYIEGVVSDISELKDAQQELARSEKRMKLALEASNEGMWEWNLKTGKAHFSKRWAEILGYAQDEINGTVTSWEKLVHPEDRSEVQDVLQKHIGGDEPYFQAEHRLRTRSGGWKWVMARGKIVERATDGKPSRIVGTHSEIDSSSEMELLVSRNKLRRRTRDLEAVNRELQAFSYSVSHDLKAPARRIAGFSGIMLDRFGDKLGEEGKEMLQNMLSHSETVQRLIDDLLKLSKVTEAQLKRDRVDLSSLAREVAEDLQQTQPERDVKFLIADDLIVEGDRSLLLLMIQNLFGNAWKFTAHNAGARIEFGTEPNGYEQTFFVKDDGIGFNAANADKLFAPFQRLHDSDQYEGSGIGLATVQRVVHRHGGRIWAEAEEGKGATFYFTLNNNGKNNDIRH